MVSGRAISVGLGLLTSLLSSCSSRTSAPLIAGRDGSPDATATSTETTAAVPDENADGGVTSKAATLKKETPTVDLPTYIKEHLPKGGSAEGTKIVHKVQPGETAQSIANAYLELTEVYKAEELATILGRKGLAPGSKIEIPKPITRVPRDPKEERLGWPEDKNLRGVFVTGSYAGIKWVELLDHVVEHGLNAVVLDGKDYEGYVNYPSKAKIAVESGANREKNIPDLKRAIRFAHWRGVHVILRIPCFHDPWADKHLKDSRLSFKFAPTGKPIHIEWIDPTNPEAQEYVIELAKEGLEAGADEIQLDYVRFPVHLTQKTAVMPDPKDRSGIMRDFVKRVKAVTSASGAFLSLDFFGVAATGDIGDIERLGQHIPTVAPEADAISLMSYPSHYNKGYMGFTNPGDHPEIIGMGNKAALQQLKPTGAKTILRTWLQAFPLRVTNYGPKYVVDQAKSAEDSGGHGWLMWSPGCEYSAVWGGFKKAK